MAIRRFRNSAITKDSEYNSYSAKAYGGRPAATGGTESTVNDYKVHTYNTATTSSPFTVSSAGWFDFYATGAGGGGGGFDGASLGSGGGSGAIIYGSVYLIAGSYTVGVGGGGGAGASTAAGTGGGLAGTNGGGTGGVAGATGTSGSGGGSGGWSGLLLASSVYFAAGGGAGGGGGGEGTANDVAAAGGNFQPAGVTTTLYRMTGHNGTAFSGDGGGGGAGGGGYPAGLGQSALTTSGQASGGTNYSFPEAVGATSLNGNNGTTAGGGAAVSVPSPWTGYASIAGAGGAQTPTAGSSGLVVIRYRPIAYVYD